MQIMLVGWFAVGLLAGAVVAWLIGNARLASERGIAQERIAARERELQALVSAAEESLRQRKEDEQTLKDSFAALAASALDANSRRLTDMAKTELTNQQKEAANKLTEKETA
ncbi:MAG TPA: hypothetical protein VMQ60_03605, partial [Acidobacteriaceae bacterium]|nr:hypothetical protein [Acidobacteriaceae bacterium]